jgi:hypothetical protein
MASYMDGMNDYLSGTNGKGYSLTNGLAKVGSTYWDSLGRSPELGVMDWYEKQIAGGADINSILGDIRNSPEAMGRAPQMPQTTPLPQVPQGGGYTSQNPYLSDMGDEIGRRTQQGLGQAFNQIRSNSIGVGGIGGSRQGVAEGIATGNAMDSMQGQLAGLYGNQYNQDQNRSLQRHGIDTAQILGMTNAANNRHATDVNNVNTNRDLDLKQTALGSDLYTQGLQNDWIAPLNASKVYQNFTGFGTNNSTTGGDYDWARFGGNAGAAWDYLNKNWKP